MNTFLILVVEDSRVVRMLTQKQLKILGYTSEAVGTGEEALARDSDSIALILMDIGLPGMDGCQAALLIREKELSEKRKRVPIIALTAHSDKQTCALAGMDDYLQKPAMLADIERILNKWLLMAS
jgi:two-component system sensor histidine kinase EvgS